MLGYKKTRTTSAWEGIDLVEQIKEDLGMNKRPKTSLVFDPLQTIGK